jgi:hypothetical protein
MHHCFEAQQAHNEINEGGTMQEHTHYTTSNREDVYQSFVGCTLRGHILDMGTRERTATILVFQCGWGLAIYPNDGYFAYWSEAPHQIQSILRKWRKSLISTENHARDLLALAGEPLEEDDGSS